MATDAKPAAPLSVGAGESQRKRGQSPSVGAGVMARACVAPETAIVVGQAETRKVSGGCVDGCVAEIQGIVVPVTKLDNPSVGGVFILKRRPRASGIALDYS